MNAVNLLPEKHRPRQRTDGNSRSGHIFLGVLGVVLVGVLGYVLTLNSINSSKTKITEATAEAQRLNDQANSLGSYGDFAKIKAERVASVKQLATQRFDYERLVRELARVLPPDVWLTNASATDEAGAGPAAGTSGAATTTPTTTPSAPTLTLSGCARDQSQVAVTLVRLRQLQGAADVQLDHSSRPDEETGGAAAPVPSDSAGGAGDDGCGTTDGKPNYEFQANVTFAPIAGDQPTNAPKRLGGGA
jgi:Tfp pilus assembly protein PilN